MTIPTQKLGESDLEVSRVIFGAWAVGGSMWGGQDPDQAIAAIHAGIDAGIHTIDTAAVYGLGQSEELVGRALRTMKGRRDRVCIATKCGLNWKESVGPHKFDMTDVDGSKRPIHNDLRPQRIRTECEDSLRRLGVDTIDLYQIHWPEPGRPVEEALATLVDLRKEGKILHIGVSNFSPEELRVARRVAGIVSTQPLYNLLDRKIEQGVLPVCVQENIGVIVYSPMARGLLTGKIAAAQKLPANDHRSKVGWFQDGRRQAILQALERARPIAERYGVSLANLAVAWTLARPGISAAIVGARTPAQAEENAKAASVPLTLEDRDALGALFEGK